MTKTYDSIDPTIVNKGIWSDDTVTLVSVACYPIAGGCFTLGFNLNAFLYDLDEIFSK